MSLNINKDEKIGILGSLFLVGVVIAGFIGWVLNLAELFTATAAMGVGEIIVRVIGVVIPFIGAILGYI